MKPFRVVPAFLLKLVLLAPFLLSLSCVSRAQLVTTATYTSNTIGAQPSQKSIAIGADGYARFVVEDQESYPELVYVRCLDQACDSHNTRSWQFSWSAAPLVQSLAVGPDGNARIAYQTFGPNPGPDGETHNTLALIQCGDVDCATSSNNPMVAYTADSTIASVAVGSNGTAYIVYDSGNAEDGPQGIGVATCNSGGCSTADIVSDLSTSDALGATIAIGPDGSPVISYVIANNDLESVYYYQNGTSTLVSSDVSMFTDVSIGPDGFARMLFENGAFWNSSESPAMNFVQCTNTSCSSAVTKSISVPSQGQPYDHVEGSVGVAPDGTPRAQIDSGACCMYTDASYYVVCATPDCSSYTSQVISAVSEESAGVASLAMGSDGGARMIAEDTNGVFYQIEALVPTISGPNTLWWFKGLGNGVSGYATQITLTASADGLGTTYVWSVASGSDKISLSTSTSSTNQVTSVGQSTTANDASVTVTVGGVTSAPFKLTVRAPYTLGTDPNNPTPVYSMDRTYVWSIQIPYRVLDNLLTPMPNPVSINENWTTPVANDYLNTNWRQGAAGCATLGSGGTFADLIEGETPDRTPTPVYNPQQNGSAVQHWGQEWRVGTCMIGSGPRVQTDTLQKYTDHAAHTGIVSPAP